MALGDGAAWSESEPTNQTVANQIDDYNRDLRVGVSARMRVEHIWPASQTGTSQAGNHTFITFQAQTAAPTMAASSAGALFVKSSGLDLWFTDSGATDRQVCLLSSAAQTHLGTVTFAVQPLITVSGTLATGVITYAQLQAFVPTGVIQMYGASAAPTGWYACTGGNVDTSSDAALFAVIGSSFGVGATGAGMFSLPKFTNRFPYGAIDGTAGGNASIGSAKDRSEMAGTDNAVTCIEAAENIANVGGNTSQGAVETIPSYLAVNFIIKR